MPHALPPQPLTSLHHLPLPLRLITSSLGDIQSQPLSVKVDLVVTILENASDAPCVFEFSEIDVAATLLDGVSDQLGGAGLTLGAHDRGLLLLSGLVDDEGGALGVLLGDLLCFDGGGELGGEGEMLEEDVCQCMDAEMETRKSDLRSGKRRRGGC